MNFAVVRGTAYHTTLKYTGSVPGTSAVISSSADCSPRRKTGTKGDAGVKSSGGTVPTCFHAAGVEN